MTARRHFPDRIVLCGFAGSGKSTIAPRLAKAIGYRVIDTDALIEKLTGTTVSFFFAERGESAFRKCEQAIVKNVLRQSGVVIAIGGGALLNRTTRAQIAQFATLVYLKCARAELVDRLQSQSQRPLLAGSQVSKKQLDERIKVLLERRIDGYSKAQMRISTTNARPGETVKTLVRTLQLRGSR